MPGSIVAIVWSSSTTGVPEPLSAGASIRSRALITSPRSSVGCTWIAATRATSGSSASAEIESRKSSGFAEAAPVASSGLRRVQNSGRKVPSLAFVASASTGSRTPEESARSATRSQAPPDIETTPRPPGPSGPVRDNRPAVVTSCSRDRTRMTPSWRSAASTRRSSPTSAPVWLRAISAASSLEPILRATIGLPSSAARCASERNRLASRIDSMNIATERTRSSSTRRAAIVVVSTIDSLPVETTWLTPMFCCAAKAEIVCAVAPLCDTIAIAPGVSSGIRPDHAGTLSRRLMKPRQFGPTQVTPSCTARSVISCCRARPVTPISSKPAASTTAKRIPAAAMSRSASATASAPTSRRARSTGSPIWAHEVKAGCPWTMPPLRFTRCTSPANPSRAKFEKDPADQAERSEAPTMTTLRGASNGLSAELSPFTVRSIRVAASRRTRGAPRRSRARPAVGRDGRCPCGRRRRCSRTGRRRRPPW